MARNKGTKNGNGNVYKRGNIWWYCLGNVRKSTGCTSERDARRYLAARVEEAKATAKAARVESSPLDEVYRRYEAQVPATCKMGKTTRDYYARYWKRFAEWLQGRGIADAAQINEAVAREYVATLVTLPRSSVCKIVFALGKVWKLGVSKSTNPFAAIKPDKIATGADWQYDRLSEGQIDRLLESAALHGEEWRLLFLIAATTGMRRKDCVLLSTGDCDFEKRQIRLQPHKTDAYGTTILVPVVPALYAELGKRRFDTLDRQIEAALHDKPIPAAAEDSYYMPALVKLYKEHLSTFSATIDDIFDGAGIPRGIHTRNGKQYRFSFHSLRVSLASRLAESGCPISVATKIMGHSPEMFARYFRPDEAVMAEYMGKAMQSKAAPVELA